MRHKKKESSNLTSWMKWGSKQRRPPSSCKNKGSSGMMLISRRSNLRKVTGLYFLTLSLETTKPSLPPTGWALMKLFRFMTMDLWSSQLLMEKDIPLLSMVIAWNFTPSPSARKIFYTQFLNKVRLRYCNPQLQSPCLSLFSFNFKKYIYKKKIKKKKKEKK